MKNRKASGTAMVEFALVIPLLALMLFGIIQYGFILTAYITVRNASAVAARHAILGTSPSEQDIQDVARAALTPMLKTNVTGLTINVTTNETVGGQSNAKAVDIIYPLDLFFPFVVPGPNPFNIQAKTVAR